MVSKIYKQRAAGVLLAALLTHTTNAQVTTITQVWASVDHPASVEASVVAVNTLTDTLGTTTVWTYNVDCPAASSPDNDNCRSRQFYPQQWVHTQGSVFEGTATEMLENSTTTWTCALGGCPGCRGYTGTNDASCTSTVISGGSTVTGSQVMSSCFLEANYVPVVLTAGADKLVDAITDLSASDFLKSVDSALASYGCPTRTTMFPTPLSVLMAQPPPNPGQTTSSGPTQTGSSKPAATTTAPTTSAAPKPSGSTSGGGSWRQAAGTAWGRPLAIFLGMTISLLSQTLG
jgi:hypothetical protein